MITYELAKELKNAGLKLYRKGIPLLSNDKGRLYIEPTLSELINACGEKFTALEKVEGWHAYYDGENVYQGFGTTPEESVAQLWINLHT